MSFSTYLIPFWLKILPERGFLIFFAIFFGVFFPWSSINGIEDKKFFASFSAYLIPFWLKILPERGFLIFFKFFSEFLAQFDFEWNSGIKFFSRFLGLSHPVLTKNNVGKRFFNFFNFFAIFFAIFFPGWSANGIRD